MIQYPNIVGYLIIVNIMGRYLMLLEFKFHYGGQSFKIWCRHHFIIRFDLVSNIY